MSLSENVNALAARVSTEIKSVRAALAKAVTLDTAQTITATKTFSSSPVVPDGSFSVSKLSATGTRDVTTVLRGDNTWGATTPVKSSATNATSGPSYPDGISFQFATTADGFPNDGILETIRDSTSGVVRQTLRTGHTGTTGSGTNFIHRTWQPGITTPAWSSWVYTDRIVVNVKGDMIVRDSSTTQRLPVGANTQVLTADSATTLGVKWANPSVTAAQVSDSTTVGRNVLTAADAAAARSAIGAGTSSFSGSYTDLSSKPTNFLRMDTSDTQGVYGSVMIFDTTLPGKSLELSATGAATTGTLLAEAGVYDGAERVYSPLNPPPGGGGGTEIIQQATQPANMTDGQLWIDTDAPDPTGSYLTTDTPQTITALKTIGNGEFDFAGMASAPPSPASNHITLFAINDADGVTRLKLKYADGSTASMRSVEPYPLSVTGTLTVQTGKSRIYLEDDYVVETIRASVNTPSAGAPIIVDVNLNGTSVYGTQANRPTIAVGTNTALGGTPTTTTWLKGQYFTLDIDQVGSTTAGDTLTVVVRLRRI